MELITERDFLEGPQQNGSYFFFLTFCMWSSSKIIVSKVQDGDKRNLNSDPIIILFSTCT